MRLGEQLNVADKYPDVVYDMEQIIQQEHEPSADFKFE
jgi:hypothetical protein